MRFDTIFFCIFYINDVYIQVILLKFCIFCYILYWTPFDKWTCEPILEVPEQLGDLLTKAKIRNKAKMLPHLIEKINPAQWLGAKYGLIKRFWYITEDTFPPAATA